MSAENTNTNRLNWHINVSKGILDAIIEVGTHLDYFHEDKNDQVDGGMEALVDTIDDCLARMESENSDSNSYMKYSKQVGRVNGYIQMLRIMRGVAEIQGH